jgi:integrase
MKVLTENIYLRGANRIAYVRRRIPTAIRAAYPPNVTHIIRSLGTADVALAKKRARKELTAIDEEFEQKREKLDLGQASVTSKRIAKLSAKQLDDTIQFFMRSVLQFDDHSRQSGFADGEFDALSERLTSQRAELGRTLAQGKAITAFPVLHGFLHLCGLDYAPNEDEAKRASYAFLRGVISTLDHQISRQDGNIVDTDSVAAQGLHPLQIIAPERAPTPVGRETWEKVFEAWNVFTDNRPKSTTISAQTPWRDLRRFAALSDVLYPAQVTPKLMNQFAQDMKSRGLAVDTINERLSKIKAIYRIAVGRELLTVNPANDTLGYKENTVQRRQKRRLPFDLTDINVLFGSEIFVRHARSQGQSGEASYWIPLLMYYTGARPEEIAGLALSDLIEDSEHGWYFSIVDRPTSEDLDLFSDVPKTHCRTLKNAASLRKVPIARELIELGLLRYVSWLKANGSTVLFPTLAKDWHGKLSGSFSKFFGRYMRAKGISDKRKVLYSFRHTMKDLLETAKVPSKYLQRLLGHTTGDGAMTDRYGSDLPFEVTVEHFIRIKFPPIPAKPWEPGKSTVSLTKKEPTETIK